LPQGSEVLRGKHHGGEGIEVAGIIPGGDQEELRSEGLGGKENGMRKRGRSKGGGVRGREGKRTLGSFKALCGLHPGKSFSPELSRPNPTTAFALHFRDTLSWQT
jgi:hypothetical protein